MDLLGLCNLCLIVLGVKLGHHVAERMSKASTQTSRGRECEINSSLTLKCG